MSIDANIEAKMKAMEQAKQEEKWNKQGAEKLWDNWRNEEQRGEYQETKHRTTRKQKPYLNQHPRY